MIKIVAPAKVNLFLHVTGQNKKNYHILQSLVYFADFGDFLSFTPADEFGLSFDSTAAHLPTADNNIIFTAATLLANILDEPLKVHIHLQKNIPIGAGLGGGSSDAAAAVKGLLAFWKRDIELADLDNVLLQLGADVPSCYHGKACFMQGIGEDIAPLEPPPALQAVLIYPNIHCATKDIFAEFNGAYSSPLSVPDEINLDYLLEQHNDLTRAATTCAPEIRTVLDALQEDENCTLARMSGSGSACFGLYEAREEANIAAENFKQAHEDWWVQAVSLG